MRPHSQADDRANGGVLGLDPSGPRHTGSRKGASMTTTSWGDTHTDTAATLHANTLAGLDLLAKGTAHGLAGLFHLSADAYKARLQCWHYQDVQRWASYVGVDIAYTRSDGHLYAAAAGRWHDRPVELCSSDSIAFLTDTTCPQCDGSGEVGTGLREHDTGAWRTTDCGLCEATGTLAVRA